MSLDRFAVYRCAGGADHLHRMNIMHREAKRKLRTVAAMEGGSDSNDGPGADCGRGSVTDIRQLYTEPERFDGGAGMAPPSSATTQAWNTLSRAGMPNNPSSVVVHNDHGMGPGHSAGPSNDHATMYSAHHNPSRPQNPSHGSDWPPNQSLCQGKPLLDGHPPPQPGPPLEPMVQVTVVDLTARPLGGQTFCYPLACTGA
ncbi:hypothetical protein RB597_001779 [Gaeumannomyces tritici]